MSSTTHPPWHSQWVTRNPTILPHAFHNARYAGWPHPPVQLPHPPGQFPHPPEQFPHPTVQLPHVTSPLSTARHITVANDIPSHCPQINAAHTQSSSYPAHLQYERHSHMNLGVQASANKISPVDCNIPNSRLIYDHSVPRTVSSNVNETQNAYPHPFLSMSFVPIRYDLRFPHTSLAFPLSSLYAGCGYELLFVPLTPERPRQIRLISPDFPWTFDICPDPGAGEEGVTCLDVLATLHAALQHPLTDTEWGTAGHDRRASLIRARDRRPMIQPALQGGSNSAARTRPTVRFAPSALVPNHISMQRERLLLRVNWLGSRVAFAGLMKDEAFARSRLFPGGHGGEPPETWVVKFHRL